MIGRNIGNYVVLEKVGEGGMGVVYLAEHPLIGRQVAVKVLHPHLANHPPIVARLYTEARSAYEVRSANIVEILDFGMLEDQTTYFIMEWLEGRTLATELRSSGRMRPERAVPIAIGIARALFAAHAQGIVHRDLKPDNIFLIERDGDLDFVKVLDFGIAKVMDEEEFGAAARAHVLMGTPAYMSPEQCHGDPTRIDHRSDIYSFGMILYQLVVGRPPFGYEPIQEVLRRQLNELPEPPSHAGVELPPGLERLILRTLEKDRARRVQSAEELLRHLRAVPLPERVDASPLDSGPIAVPSSAQEAVAATLHFDPSLEADLRHTTDAAPTRVDGPEGTGSSRRDGTLPTLEGEGARPVVGAARRVGESSTPATASAQPAEKKS